MKTRWMAAGSLLVLLAVSGCKSGDDGLQTTTNSSPTVGRSATSTPCTTSTVISEPAIPESPLFTLDPLGPMLDVTCEWQHYQPADDFCVKLDAPEFTPGGTGPLYDGRDPACQFAGFAESDTGLYKVQIPTPPLCAGCRRVFMDFSAIPEDDAAAGLFYAHGHAFYRIMSLNPTYTIEPNSHSPNTKNFYNDKLVSPPGTPIEQGVGALDTHFMAYVTHTRFFAHTGAQGVHYIGPWYVNRDGERIHGIYVDVNVGDAMASGDPDFDAFRYMTSYNSGQVTCFDNLSAMTSGGNMLYGGCFDRIGGSSIALDPF